MTTSELGPEEGLTRMKEVAMAEDFVASERIWRCACHFSPHFVAIAADPIAPDVAEDPGVWGWFSVEVTDGPMSFRDRVRESWKLLRSRGHRYCFGDVMLDPKSAREIRDHLSAYLEQPTSRGGTRA